MRNLLKSLLLSVGLLAIGYVGWGVVTYRHYAQAFAETKGGESLELVLQRFGQPSHIEPRSKASGYDSGSRSTCGESCWLRLWYEMPFTLGVAPLSIDFNAQQKVIDKYEWNSP